MALIMADPFILEWATGRRCRRFLLLTHEIVFYFIVDSRRSRVTLSFPIEVKSIFSRTVDRYPLNIDFPLYW
jgi:hypothetical protein